MVEKNMKTTLSVVLSFILIVASTRTLYGYQSQAPATPTDSGNPTEPASHSTSKLESLVAPIALYPDALVAQILTAATFPDQVAVADYWLHENSKLTGSALMKAVDKQSWDPSVKALTQFPSVLDNMSKNLAWTSSLGEAFHNQQADVMSAIQALRAQAKAAGNLKSTPQQTVVQQSPQVIVIEPTNPEVVYVPVYDTTVVYGTTYVTSDYSAGDVAAAGIIGFGTGVAVGAAISGGCCSWGYSSWSCSWSGTAVSYNGGAYYGNGSWHSGYYRGYNTGNNNGSNHGNNYNSGNTYNNNVNVNNNSAENKSAENNSAENKSAENKSAENKSAENKSAENKSANHTSGSNFLSQHSGSGSSNAFSGMSGHSDGPEGLFGGSSPTAESSRGWGSLQSRGFGGPPRR